MQNLPRNTSGADSAGFVLAQGAMQRPIARRIPKAATTESRRYKRGGRRQPARPTLCPPGLASVIVAAYRAERWIMEMVKSVRNQTHKEIELLIGVDGCEATAKVLEENNVSYYWSPKNVGSYVMRNSLVVQTDQTSTHFVVFDADDVMEQSMVAATASSAGKDGICMYMGTESDEQLRPLPNVSSYFYGTSVFSREAWSRLGGFRPDRVASDTDIQERAKQLGIPIHYLADRVIKRRRHTQQITRCDKLGKGQTARKQIKAAHRKLRIARELVVDPTTTELIPFPPRTYASEL